MGVGGMPTWVAELFEYNAGFTDKIGGQVVKTWGGPTDAFDYTLDEPWGVIAVIVPWNGPFVSFGQTLAPALAAGNTVVIKPPEFARTPACASAKSRPRPASRQGHQRSTRGPTGGNALVSHPGVDKIFFTGSGGRPGRSRPRRSEPDAGRIRAGAASQPGWSSPTQTSTRCPARTLGSGGAGRAGLHRGHPRARRGLGVRPGHREDDRDRQPDPDR